MGQHYTQTPNAHVTRQTTHEAHTLASTCSIVYHGNLGSLRLGKHRAGCWRGTLPTRSYRGVPRRAAKNQFLTARLDTSHAPCRIEGAHFALSLVAIRVWAGTQQCDGEPKGIRFVSFPLRHSDCVPRRGSGSVALKMECALGTSARCGRGRFRRQRLLSTADI